MALGSATHKRSCYMAALGQILFRAWREVYPKYSVPASDCSVFVENALLNDTRFFKIPPPLMSCSGICEIMSRPCWEVEIPYIQDGFFGPGTSPIEEVRYHLYQT